MHLMKRVWDMMPDEIYITKCKTKRKIKSYQVMLASKKEILNLQAQDFSAGDEVMIHFEGYTSSFDIPSIESEEIK